MDPTACEFRGPILKVEGVNVRYDGTQILRVPALHKDGQRLSIAFTVALLQAPDGHLAGVAAIVRDETARWQDRSGIDERTLRAALGRERILAEAKLSNNNMKTGFSYNGHYYSIDGTKLETHSIGADYLYFEIYRKP